MENPFLLVGRVTSTVTVLNTGSLPVTPETEQDLVEACVAIQEMRRDLLYALMVQR